jgi:Arc/MetJ-type ribon-helix-helix transcriptional regulator
VKLSVSLPEEDVEFLDSYADTHGMPSRSRAVQRAVNLLRAETLADDYESAFDEWTEADATVWDTAVADGLED